MFPMIFASLKNIFFITNIGANAIISRKYATLTNSTTANATNGTTSANAMSNFSKNTTNAPPVVICSLVRLILAKSKREEYMVTINPTNPFDLPNIVVSVSQSGGVKVTWLISFIVQPFGHVPPPCLYNDTHVLLSAQGTFNTLSVAYIPPITHEEASILLASSPMWSVLIGPVTNQLVS